MAISAVVTKGTIGSSITNVEILESLTQNGTYTLISGQGNVAVTSFPVTITNINNNSTYLKINALGDCTTEEKIAITGIPSTSNSFSNTNGPAPLYPQANLLSGTWSITRASGGGQSNSIFSLDPINTTYSNTGLTPNFANINMSGTSISQFIKLTFQMLNSPSDGINGFTDLQITDGTNTYVGLGSKDGLYRYLIEFDIGTTKGRSFTWGSASSTDPGEVNISNGQG